MFITGDIRYQMPIVCSRCGLRALSTHRMTLVGVWVEDVDSVIRQHFRQQTPDIPVGWAMFGRDDVRCPDHITE